MAWSRYALIVLILPVLLWLAQTISHTGPNGRPLRAGEVEAMSHLFDQQLDYLAVRVHAVWLPARWTALVLGERILYRRGYYLNDFSKHPQRLALLGHELTHVWQYQHHGPGAVIRLLREHLTLSSAVYAFDRRQLGYAPLHDFALEAQGQIVAEYLARKQADLPRDDFLITLAASLPLAQPSADRP